MTEFLVWFGIMVGSYILILLFQFAEKVGEKLFNAVQRKWRGTF
jgi:hypothetical protein